MTTGSHRWSGKALAPSTIHIADALRDLPHAAVPSNVTAT